jgi:hypothetical protein
MEKYYLNWNECDFTWIGNDYTWNDVALVLEVASGGGAPIENYQALPKAKKDHFIILILKVKEQEIKHVIKKKNIKVTAQDIELVINSVLKPKVNLEK